MLRLAPDLHVRLSERADEHGISMHEEIVRRLEESLRSHADEMMDADSMLEMAELLIARARSVAKRDAEED